MGRHSHGDKRRLSAERSFSALPLRTCRRNRTTGYREGLGQSGHLVAHPQGDHFRWRGDSDRHRDPVGRKSGRACCERHGFMDRRIGASACNRAAGLDRSINRRRAGFTDPDKRCADARRNGCGCRACRSRPGRDRSAPHGRPVQAIPGLGGGGRYPGTGRALAVRASFTPDTACTASARTARAGGAGCPGTGPACEEVPAGPVRAQCARRDPAPATCPGKVPGRAKAPGADRARTRTPITGAASSTKLADTVAPAKPGFAQLDLPSAARVSAATPGPMSKHHPHVAKPFHRARIPATRWLMRATI